MTTMTPSATDIRAEVRIANDKFQSAFKQGDSAAISKLYTEDGLVLAPGSDFIKGPQAIQNFWQGAMDLGIKEARLDSIEVEQHNDTAIELGNYGLNAADGQQLDKGKYIVIWKFSDNQWKIFKDIWNSNTPSAQ